MEIGGGGAAVADALLLNSTTNLTDVPADISMTPAQLQLGFRTVMAWGVFAAIGLTLASRVAKEELREKATYPIAPRQEP